jgi:Uma2 family endonuclease
VPDLVVEVTSPNDVAWEVEAKIDEWLGAGVKLVWEVYPESQTVRAHRSDGPIAVFRATDTLTAPDLLPGFAVPGAALFEIPLPQPPAA